nr:uncharacterized protein LOC122272488 [Parasteatoda tepidariorum]
MATVGSIQEFDTSNPNSFELYANQITYFLEANSIEDDKEHFCPKSSEIFRRFKFHKRFQSKLESVNAYVTELRKLAEDCNFGETLSERLRDQLVCGIRDEEVQRRLLAESKLTLENAISVAVASEVAASQSKHIHTQNSSYSENSDVVDFVRGCSKSQTQNSKVCFGCGGKHERSTCKFKNAICHSCGLKGHIVKVCRKKNKFEKQRANEIEVQPDYLNVLSSQSPRKTLLLWSIRKN